MGRIRDVKGALERAEAAGLAASGLGARFVVRKAVGGAPRVGAVVWNAERGVVYFECAAPLKVTAENAGAIREAVADVNSALPELGLVVRSAGVFFATHAHLDDDGAISERAFDAALALVFDGLEAHAERLGAAAAQTLPARRP